MRSVAFLLILLTITSGTFTAEAAATSTYTSSVCTAYKNDDAASVKGNTCVGNVAADGKCHYCTTCAGTATAQDKALTLLGTGAKSLAGLTTYQLIDNDNWSCYADASAAPKTYSLKPTDATKTAKCSDLKRNWDTTATAVSASIPCVVAATKAFCQICAGCPTAKPTVAAAMSYAMLDTAADSAATWDALCTAAATTTTTTTTGTGTTTTGTTTTASSTSVLKLRVIANHDGTRKMVIYLCAW